MKSLRIVIQIIEQIQKTIKERRSQRNSKIKYFNFWEIESPESVWFSKFIELNSLNPRNKKINFVSVFGDVRTYHFVSHPRFFYSGEDLSSSVFPDLNRFKKISNNFNLFLSFDMDQTKNKFYLPLWFLSFVDPDSTQDSLKQKLDRINLKSYRCDLRNKFACQVSSHDANGVRAEVINLLSSIENVHCGGKFMNNSDILQKNCGNDKIEFLKGYKFNICPENSDTPGYVTEKIFDSILAGCIPIYWSENNIADSQVLNKDAILFYDKNNPLDLYNRVKELHSNEFVYNEFISRPIFLDTALSIIMKQLDDLKIKFKEIIDVS